VLQSAEMPLGAAPVVLLDSTLREGEQRAGVRLDVSEKIPILHLLEDFGVRIVEVGHPAISEDDERICREVRAASRQAEILMHSRASLADVEAVHRARADWIGIWASCNDLALRTKFADKSVHQIMQMVSSAVMAAKDLGLRVRFTVEDASRTEWDLIAEAAWTALQAGADRISLADTVGVLEPKSCAVLFSRAATEFPCEIEGHFHNDMGLALANALVAMDSGARVVDVSVLGIGERVGITDLLQLTVVLATLREDARFSLGLIPTLASTVAIASGYEPDDARPVIGRKAFTHGSAYHVAAVERDPAAYEPYSPSVVGAHRRLQENRPSLRRAESPVALRIRLPLRKGASELRFHRDGPGVRWVLLDSRVDDRASFYVMQRRIGTADSAEPHVDIHRHNCDSALVFFGNGPGGEGLTCGVLVGTEHEVVSSPCTVFVPASLDHCYRYVEGDGTVLNIVLASDYHASLLDADPSEHRATPAGRIEGLSR
jgi:isopropylmalate/homocitrate/citramalate synthase